VILAGEVGEDAGERRGRKAKPLSTAAMNYKTRRNVLVKSVVNLSLFAVDSHLVLYFHLVAEYRKDALRNGR
jgi:hypothetical protein